MMDIFDHVGHFVAYTHNGDAALMQSLGLPTHASPAEPRGYCDLGTLEPDSDGRPVKIEVMCLPAQCWRFTVDGLVFTTGSGGFSYYWPFLKLVREGMLVPEARA